MKKFKIAWLILTLIFSFICLGVMIYFASKGKIEWTICFGVFSIFNYLTFIDNSK